MTDAEFENIVEEAWERHHDMVRLRVKQPEDNNEFWFWGRQGCLEAGLFCRVPDDAGGDGLIYICGEHRLRVERTDRARCSSLRIWARKIPRHPFGGRVLGTKQHKTSQQERRVPNSFRAHGPERNQHGT
jgi:hypothetical protein